MKNRSYDIIHVYAGTSGSAGTYINEIYTNLKGDFKQEVFVNFYFPFDYGKKYFYRYSELSSPYILFKRNNTLRRVIRYFELLVTLIRILIFISKNKVKLINYSLTSDLTIEFWFLSVLKLFKITIAITCHDVIPFGLDSKNRDRRIKLKKRFFDLADCLIVHNNNSINELVDVFSINKVKIYKYLFPIMDLGNFPQSVADQINSFPIKDDSTFRIGMVGHFRKEKGLDVLLKAWKLVQHSRNNIELFLVGNFADGIKSYDIGTENNIHVYDQFVDDSMYISIIRNCDLIVLPYKIGTNSGIPSSVISLGTLLITSNIEMFKNNSLICSNSFFSSEDEIDLHDKILWFSSLSTNERKRLVDENYISFNNYKIAFKNSIHSCYSVICK